MSDSPTISVPDLVARLRAFSSRLQLDENPGFISSNLQHAEERGFISSNLQHAEERGFISSNLQHAENRGFISVPLQIKGISPSSDAIEFDETQIAALSRDSPSRLFPGVRDPEGALCGLLLFSGRWSMAHELVDDRQTPDGCYWHALVHRTEPDTWNSDYWFRQVGRHPLFPEVLATARRLAAKRPAVGLRFDTDWNPAVFNSWCEQARAKPHAERSSLVAAIHSAECHLLWNYSMDNISGENKSG